MLIKLLLKRVFLIFLILMLFISARGATITSFSSGNWSDSTTWVGGIVPGAGDDVSIAHAVTIDQNISIKKLTIQQSGSLLAGNGIFELRVGGAITNMGTIALYSDLSNYVDLVIDGNSMWTGVDGTWKFASIHLNAGAVWSFEAQYEKYFRVFIERNITKEGAVTVAAQGSYTEFVFIGEQASVLSPDIEYPALTVDKSNSATVEFPKSTGPKTLLIWDYISLKKQEDILVLNDNNRLEIYQDDFGPGSFQGGADGPALMVYKQNSGDLGNLNIRSGAIELENNFTISGTLRLTEPTSSIDINGHTLTLKGTWTGAGRFKANESSTLIIDKAPTLGDLSFVEGSSLKLLRINSTAQGSSIINIKSNLQIAESLDNIPASNQLVIDGTSFELKGTYSGSGTLAGKGNSILQVTGDGAQVDIPITPGTAFENVEIARAGGAIFRNSFSIVDELAVGSNLRVSDGTLTLGSGSNSRGALALAGSSSLDLGNGSIIFSGNAPINIPVNAFLSTSDNSEIKITGPTQVSLRFNAERAKSTVKALMVNKDNATVSIESPLFIREKLEVDKTGSTLDSKGNITLLSSATQTANVAPLGNGSKIDGQVKVERFVSGGPKASYRGYRMLSSPVYDNSTVFTNSGPRSTKFSQYIDDIYVTGTAGSAGGFDTFSGNPNNPTIWTYDESATTSSGKDYVGISQINDAIPAGCGSMIFFRGGRTNPAGKLKAPYDDPENVIIDFDGILNQGDISVPLTFTSRGEGTDGFNLLGNPYASTIDWHAAGWGKTNITGQIWIYNPSIKQYAIYDGSNGTNGATRYISPGQAFFVKATAPGNITFREGIKAAATASRDFSLFMNAQAVASNGSLQIQEANNGQDEKIRLRLVKEETSSDEALIVFRPGCKAEANQEDARDMHGEGVYLSSYSADSAQLGINYMPQPHTLKTVLLYVSASAYGSYSLEFPEVKLSGRTRALLRDNFLSKSVELNAPYAFEITSDKNSYGADRFQIVFEKIKLPVTLSEFTGKKMGAGVKLDWSTEVEPSEDGGSVLFELERSTDGATFQKIADVVGQKSSAARYTFLDKTPAIGSNYYRLRTLFDTNEEELSSVVMIDFDLLKGSSGPVLYPNPAETELRLFFQNIKKTSALLVIYDKGGKKVVERSLGLIEDGSEIQQDVQHLSQGIYFVEVLDAKTKKQIFSSKLIKK